jgi:hypothetical protein
MALLHTGGEEGEQDDNPGNGQIGGRNCSPHKKVSDAQRIEADE